MDRRERFNRRSTGPSERPTGDARQNAFSFSPGFFCRGGVVATPERAGR